MNKLNSVHTNGKLLLTAEYFVLDGALALALPVKYGQTLNVFPAEHPGLHWQSLDHQGVPWFEAQMNVLDFSFLAQSDEQIALQLQKILRAIRSQNSFFLNWTGATRLETRLEFPREWGFGSSSTLIAALAIMSGVDPFRLLRDSFGGSGYDIACAIANGPILYQLNPKPNYVEIPFQPSFHEQLYFVYLGKKQNSREAIARYREKSKRKDFSIQRMNELTMAFLTTTDFSVFEEYIRLHEAEVAKVVDLPRAKDLYFKDYWGEVKSLGAWGGDFVMVTSEKEVNTTLQYFQEKGHQTVFRYADLIL